MRLGWGFEHWSWVVGLGGYLVCCALAWYAEWRTGRRMAPPERARIAEYMAELESRPLPDSDPHPEVLGILQDGSNGATRAALTWLHLSGAASVSGLVRATGPLPAGSGTVARAIHADASTGSGIHREDLNPRRRHHRALVNSAINGFIGDLQDGSLLYPDSPDPSRRSRSPVQVAWGALPLAGAILVLDGAGPALLILAAAALLMYSTARGPGGYVSYPFSRTPFGMRLLRRARERYAKLDVAGLDPAALAAATIVLGPEVLAEHHPDLYNFLCDPDLIGPDPDVDIDSAG